jgi:predicted metal-dependent phosphoesterase TrpH
MKRAIVADLHNHTKASDGEYSAEELVVKAKEIGLKGIGVTDHDTLAALKEAVDAGKKNGIDIITGTEVTLRFKEEFFVGSLHCLLYFSEKLLEYEEFVIAANELFQKGRGPALVEVRVKEINRIFGPNGTTPFLKRELTVEEISSYSPNVSRRHFALALQEKHQVTSKDDVNMLIGNSSPAYIPSGVAMTELHQFINKFPVVTVFAHPAAGSFPGDSHYKEVLPSLDIVEQLLPEFLSSKTLGINGIEVYYPGHTDDFCHLLQEWAERYNLLITGGSDCHDDDKRPLGVNGVTDDELNILKEEITEIYNNWAEAQ